MLPKPENMAQQNWLLQNAQILHFSPARVERADIHVQNGQIIAVGPNLQVDGPVETMDLQGFWVMPGLVCGHTHLYSALACGMPLPSAAPENFAQMLEQVWWRLDKALHRESNEISALVGGLQALRSGVTTLVDHHASPNAIDDSLLVLDDALSRLGTRRVLCYEVSDRDGPEKAKAGVKAHETLLSTPLASGEEGMRAVMIGAHANFTLSDETLSSCAALAKSAGVGLHIHTAEAIDDEKVTGENPVKRLERLGALLPGSLLAHCVHVSEDQLKRIEDAGAWVSHQARSNMNNGVGYAPVQHYQPQTILGTDGIGADMFTELQSAWFRAQEGGVPWSPARWLETLTQTHVFAGQKLGVTLGKIEKGAAADLVVLDPIPGPPLNEANLAAAMIFRFSSQMVRNVMVQGKWRLWDRYPTGINTIELDQQAQSTSQALWDRMSPIT